MLELIALVVLLPVAGAGTAVALGAEVGTGPARGVAGRDGRLPAP